jgi:hypothetical protein
MAKVVFRDEDGVTHPIETHISNAIQEQRLRFKTIGELQAHFRKNPVKPDWVIGGRLPDSAQSFPAAV